MISFKRLDHVAVMIPRGKTAEAKAFYGGVLQLREIPGQHPRNATWYEMGDVQLHLVEEDGLPDHLSGRHPAFEVNGLEAAKTFLQNNGIEIAYSSVITGRERFFFRDVFGNRIELLEYLW